MFASLLIVAMDKEEKSLEMGKEVTMLHVPCVLHQV
jgi:hypothetical protein